MGATACELPCLARTGCALRKVKPVRDSKKRGRGRPERPPLSNGDEDALLERMTMVSDGEVFADHLVDPAERERISRRHDLGEHARLMKRIWRGEA